MPLDPVSRLVLDEAGSLPTRVLVVDDPDLANHLVDVGHDVLASCDDQRDQQRLSAGRVEVQPLRFVIVRSADSIIQPDR